MKFTPPKDKTGYDITLFTDASDTWIYPWLKKIKHKIKNYHRVTIVTKHKDIPKGDFNFILGSTKIMHESVLKLNHLNLVVHESALPLGKGWSPLSWQVLSGKNQIPVVLFEAVPDLDSGRIFIKDTILLDGTELLPEIKKKQGEKTLEMILEFLMKWPDIQGSPQKGEESFYPKRTVTDDMLDPNKTIAENFNHLRITNNEDYPAWFSHKGKKYILKIYPFE